MEHTNKPFEPNAMKVNMKAGDAYSCHATVAVMSVFNSAMRRAGLLLSCFHLLLLASVCPATFT